MSETERLPGLVIDIEARINKLEAGLKRASDRQKKAAAEMEARARESAEKIGDAYSRVGNGAARGFGALGAAFNRNRSAIQNTSYQLQDVIVQMTSGTSAAKALGMQLPQMLGGLGAVGAIAGVAAGALLPLAANLLQSGDEAGNLEDRLKALADSTGNMESAVASAAVPVEELRLKYKDLADEIARANGIAAGFASAIAQRDALTAAKGLTNGLTIPTPGDNLPKQWDGSVNLDRARIAADTQRDAMEKLAKTTGATGDQLDRLRMALARVESVNSLDAVVRDSENLLQVINELYAGADETQRRYLEDWAANVNAVMDSAKRQIEAQRAEDARLVAEYDANTSKMNALTADRQRAEELLTEAKTKGDSEQIASMGRVIDGIDAQIVKLKDLGETSKAVHEAMRKDIAGVAGAFLSTASSRMAGPAAVSVARQYDGMHERTNREELRSLMPIDPATTAWCAAFVTATLSKIGVKGTGSLAARSYLDWGTAVDTPAYGDVVVLKRGNNADQGHVGFYEGTNADGSIRVYGGNQGDRVGSSTFRSSDVLGYRRAPAPGQYVNPVQARDEARIVNDGVAAERADKAAEEAARKAEQAKDREAKARERNAKAAEKEAEAQSKSTLAGEAAKAAAEAAIAAQEALIDQQTTGAEAMTGVLMAAGQGADALSAKLLQLAEQILSQQLFGFLSGQPGMGWLGRLLGAGAMPAGGDALTRALAGAGVFSEGGYTGPGGKLEPAGIVHRGEYVLSKAAVARIGVPALEALHQSALRGYSGGGLVGDTGQARKAVSGSLGRSAGAPQITVNGGPITVNATGGTPEQNADLAAQIAKQHERAMRGLVQDEIVRLMRPGNPLARVR